MLAALVILALVVALPGNEGGVAKPDISNTGRTVPTPLELEEILAGTFTAPSFNGTWISDSNILLRNANGDLVLYNIDDDSTTTLISDTSQILQQAASVIQLSPDSKYVVLSYNETTVPGHIYTFVARYTVVDIASGEAVEIVPPGVESDEALLENFQWGSTGSSLAFVYLNNIYYQQSATSQPQQITTTGQPTVIFNGVPDWVYEMEIFASYNAIWFSNDGAWLAYATFDDQKVGVVKMPYYGEPGSINYQYTEYREIRHPKTGTTNPTVTVGLQDLTAGSTTTFTAPTNLYQPVLKAVKFVNNDTIALFWANRSQTTLQGMLCSATESCSQIYSYNETDGWIANIPLIFNNDGTAFITILPQTVSGVSYRQIVRISESAGTWTSSNIVNVPHTVLDILAWSADDVIWYQATSVNDPAEQHIYSISTAGDVSCFTCNIRRPNGGECLFNEGIVSTGGDKIVVNCAGPDVPQVYIYNTDGSLVQVWDDAADLIAATSNKMLPTTIRMSVPLGGDVPNADVRIKVPADYQNRTLPLLINVYAGPDTASVTKQWELDWSSSLVSRWNIAVAEIDGRGTRLRGVSNLFAIYKKVGTVEVEDQITATRYLQNTLPWIDASRTCVWGWSYGGYMASKILAKGGSVFRCAAAVAPLVDWKLFDAIYTERVMDLPENNVEGYAASALLSDELVETYRNKSYYMIHGTSDEMVHYQQTRALARTLQMSNVDFSEMTYSDEGHFFFGVAPHRFHGLEKFLNENLL